ncbi:uncharacterized protein mute isoform X2 [Centruroides vittatus]|uniref:uncharacterized protein mute isoform X2 n=1 Tax=Centruroides vittatus TaxID=120091 RepID=UPI00351050B8
MSEVKEIIESNNQGIEGCQKKYLSTLPEAKQPLKKRRIIHCENSKESDAIYVKQKHTEDIEKNILNKDKNQTLHSNDMYGADTDRSSFLTMDFSNSEAIVDNAGEILVTSPSNQSNDALSYIMGMNANAKCGDVSQLCKSPERIKNFQKQIIPENNTDIVISSEVESEPKLWKDIWNCEQQHELLNQTSSMCDVSSSTKIKNTRVRRKLLMSGPDNLNKPINLDEGKLEIIEKKKIRRKRKQDEFCAQEIDDMLEGMQGEIDYLLEETAQKNKLTSTNVKNILRMDEGKYDDVEEAIYEPKLTRSKARELMEKQVTLPWPVSPLKTSKVSTTKKLLEEEFSEDESSDEEYKPNKEALCHSEDDEPLSQPSDIGSPQYSHPNTPRTPSSDTLEEFSNDNCSPSNAVSQETDRIALRTRSKLPLNDTPLEDIEASFVAPDITIDMYDSECDDEEWKDFLNTFSKPLDFIDSNDIPEDDVNDPEYNFLEEEDVLDKWDLRNDRAVKISKREFNELMAELLEAAEQEIADEEEENNNTERLSPLPDISDIVNKPATCTVFEFSKVDRERLDEQMRMHIQLLTQEFLLSKDDPALKTVTNIAYDLLEEINRFGKRDFPIGQRSAFNAYNLDEAWKLVSRNNFLNLSSKASTTVSKTARRGTNINFHTRNIIANSRVFMYPELLPSCGFLSCTEKSKVTFTQAEDHLIALGLEQFQPLQGFSTIHLIKTLMLPPKTESQIRFRIKNVKSAQFTKDNPIKYYFKHNKAPAINQTIRSFNPDLIISPSEQPSELLPEWMKPFMQRHSTVIAPLPIVVSGSQNVRTSPVYVKISPSTIVSSHQFMKTTVTSPITKTPEKRKYNPILPRPTVSSYGTSRNLQKHISPLKQISPILKKYSFQRRVLPRLQFPSSPIKKTTDKKSHKSVNVKLNFNKSETDSKVCFSPKEDPTLTKPEKPETVSKENNPEKTQIENTGNTDASCELSDKMTNNNIERSVIENSIEPLETDILQHEMDGITEIESHCDIDITEENGEGEVEDEVIDDESDLAALMAASTTICKKQHPLIKKKNKQQKELESTLALLAPDLLELDPKKEERETMFVQSYLMKAKDLLKDDVETYENFLRTLCEFENSNKTPVQLFETINMLLNGYPTLVEDFVGFLLPEQARDCGKMAEYFTLNKIRMFLRKLEVHFGPQPQYIQRILKTLSHLQWQRNLHSSNIRTALQPLFRGQNHLLEEFLQLLPDEPPPESIMTDFEEIVIPDSEEDYSNDSVEEITIPEYDNKYGGKQCPCVCHSHTTDLRMQNRIRHCIQCGIKFLGGRIYIQTGKVLKPAQVIYYTPGLSEINGDNKLDDYASPGQQGSDSPLSSLSPSPVAIGNQTDDDPQEEHEINITFSSEQEIHFQSCDLSGKLNSHVSKEQRNIVVKCLPSNELSEEKVQTSHPFLSVLEDFSPNTSTASSTLLVPSHVVIEDAILPPETSQQYCALPADFSSLRDVIKLNVDSKNIKEQSKQLCKRSAVICNNSDNMENDKKQVDKINQTDSQILSSVERNLTEVTCAMKSTSLINQQNSIININTSVSTMEMEIQNKCATSSVKWSREEDKILLETCQKLGASEDTFKLVSEQLKDKDQLQVANRFQELMKLFTTEEIEKDYDSD